MLKHYLRYFIVLSHFLSSVAFANKDYSIDATSLSLEELVETNFIPASTIANQINNAASAVSIVTAKDIRDYGYKSLKEILSSMKGLHFTKDPFYSFLGGRGFSSPSEYAGRIIVLIDGYRADDSYFGQTYFEHDGILDVSIIDRVEFIPSGGSAGYANGALLGVINIITQKGADTNGAKVALGFGSRDSQTKRVSVGTTFDNGADVLLLASGLTMQNKDYADQNIVQDGGEEKNKRFFLKTSYNNATLTSAYSKRGYSMASYPLFGILGNTPNNSDENFFTHLTYDMDVTSHLKLSSSAWYGFYNYLFLDDITPDTGIWENGNSAKWYGVDMKFVGTWFEDHTLSFGLDYRNDFQWRWFDNFYAPMAGNSFNSGRLTPRKTYSAYLYDDFKLSNDVSLNYGLRYEKNDKTYHEASPYAAIIWQALDATQLKLSTSKVFRQPTANEGEKEEPEEVQTFELVLEQKFDHASKLTSSLYQYDIKNSYGFSSKDIESKGFEIEFEKHWENGTRFKTNYTWQDSRDKSLNTLRVNSPHHTAKFNLSTPLVTKSLRLGVEAQYVSKRLMSESTSFAGDYAPAYTIANVNLLAHQLLPNLDVSFKIHNILNTHYQNVLSYTTADGKPTLSDDGRVFWLELEYTFK